jgi:hypothetical protein
MISPGLECSGSGFGQGRDLWAGIRARDVWLWRKSSSWTQVPGAWRSDIRSTGIRTYSGLAYGPSSGKSPLCAAW